MKTPHKRMAASQVAFCSYCMHPLGLYSRYKCRTVQNLPSATVSHELQTNQMTTSIHYNYVRLNKAVKISNRTNQLILTTVYNSIYEVIHLVLVLFHKYQYQYNYRKNHQQCEYDQVHFYQQFVVLNKKIKKINFKIDNFFFLIYWFVYSVFNQQSF